MPDDLLLALDSSVSGQCSAALIADAECLDYASAAVVKSNERLLPLVDTVLVRNAVKPKQLRAIVYGRGPGAFIGIRVAASVAQALAFGWGLPLLGVSCLEAVAAEARRLYADEQILVALDARMGQLYCASYVGESLQPSSDELLIKPEQLPSATQARAGMVGNAWHYSEQFPDAALASWTCHQENLHSDARMLGLVAATDLARRLQQAADSDQQVVYLRPAV